MPKLSNSPAQRGKTAEKREMGLLCTPASYLTAVYDAAEHALAIEDASRWDVAWRKRCRRIDE